MLASADGSRTLGSLEVQLNALEFSCLLGLGNLGSPELQLDVSGRSSWCERFGFSEAPIGLLLGNGSDCVFLSFWRCSSCGGI